MDDPASYGEGSFGDVMIRVGFIAYLMIATLAGPAWCCCTFDRLTLPNFQSSDPVKLSPVRACCQHRAKPEKQKSSNPTKKQDAPGKCPCKEQGSNQAPATSPDVQTGKQLGADSQTLDRDQFVGESSGLHGAGSQVPSVCFDLSRTFHLSGPALLCALQVYRC